MMVWFIRKKDKYKTVVYLLFISVAAVFLVFMHGCGIEEIDREKIRDLEYEIVPEEEIPEEVFEKIVSQYENFSRSAYLCSDILYIVVCYGAQPTEGYSIEVDNLYESSNAIIVETTLKGPPGFEKVAENISYPYIVLKLEKNNKIVVFN